MKNRKVPTGLGTVVIVIFAITIGMFVWQIEKEQDNNIAEQQQKQNPTNIETDMRIDTNNWKICESKKYGYQFKYPNDWSIHVPVNRIITDCNDQTSLVLISNLAEESLQRVTFSLVTNAPTLKEFIFQNKAEIEVDKEMTINGKKAIIYKKDGPRGEMKLITIFSDGTTYSLTAENLPSDALFEAFASSFNVLN